MLDSDNNPITDSDNYKKLLETASQLVNVSKISEENASSDEEDDNEKVMDISDRFQHISGAVIMMNTLVIGLEASYVGNEVLTPYFRTLEFFFTFMYVLELVLRLNSRGCKGFFITDDDMAWNLFDFVITSTSVLDAVNQLTGHSTGGSGASAGRLFRVLRILRLFRALRFLKELDIVLAVATKATMKLLALVLLVVIVSAIVATNALWDVEDRRVASDFSCLGVSMWTMFKLMTLDGWVQTVERIAAERPGMLLFFVAFIFFASIALMSLVPAIFIELNITERERLRQKEIETRKRSNLALKRRMLQHLFRIVDCDFDGTASIGEMQRLLDDTTMAHALAQHGKAEDLMDMRLGVFTLLEAKLEQDEGETRVTEEEFVQCVNDSWGDVDQAMIRRSITHTRQKLHHLTGWLQGEISGLRQEIRQELVTMSTMDTSKAKNASAAADASSKQVLDPYMKQAASMLKAEAAAVFKAEALAMHEAIERSSRLAQTQQAATEHMFRNLLREAMEDFRGNPGSSSSQIPRTAKLSEAEVKRASGKEKQDATEEEPKAKAQAFVVDNTILHSSAPGLEYRMSKRLNDKCPGMTVSWGSVIEGVDEGDGWISNGALFLPKDIGSVPVLVRRGVPWKEDGGDGMIKMPL